MIRFENDYGCGAHPNVLKWMIQTNEETSGVYSEDYYCDQARTLIRSLCQAPDAAVHFLTGGTMTNLTMIAATLLPYQGVVSSSVGHIAVHETGAIEAKGHKVLTIPSKDGKITAADVQEIYDSHYADESREHMVQPAMVYISQSTENGTIYTLEELDALWQTCQALDILLYIDGARLGYALSVPGAMTLPELAARCDMFYIGGTKVGALCGEAVVYTKGNTPACFVAQIKQHGALLAKGRLLGIQFDALFEDGLYFEISRHAIDMAEKLREILMRKGYPLFLDSPTNQQFVIVDNDTLASWQGKLGVSFWEKYDETHTVVRFATSWSTTEEDLAALENIL